MIQDFIDNQVIRYLANKPYWTVNIDKKKPLDILSYEQMNLLIGAKNESCLTDLSNLLRIINAIPKQFVYSLNAARDGIVVLDIEKTCPDDLKNKLLQLPFIYGDVSMSGKGFHLVFPCPQLDEMTINKVAMKEEHGYYEILLRHYVTFTGNMILPQYDYTNAPIQFQQIWDEMCNAQKNLFKKNLDIDIEDLSLDFPMYPALKDAVIRHFQARFMKTPADYGNDMSRYEFAVISSVRYSMNFLLDMPMYARRVRLDDRQKILFVYHTVSEILNHREKHDEKRGNQPLLLYQTYNNFALSMTDNSDNNESDED